MYVIIADIIKSHISHISLKKILAKLSGNLVTLYIICWASLDFKTSFLRLVTILILILIHFLIIILILIFIISSARSSYSDDELLYKNHNPIFEFALSAKPQCHNHNYTITITMTITVTEKNTSLSSLAESTFVHRTPILFSLRWAGGNPLYIWLLHHHLQRGHLQRAKPQWNLQTPGQLSINIKMIFVGRRKLSWILSGPIKVAKTPFFGLSRSPTPVIFKFVLYHSFIDLYVHRLWVSSEMYFRTFTVI